MTPAEDAAPQPQVGGKPEPTEDEVEHALARAADVSAGASEKEVERAMAHAADEAAGATGDEGDDAVEAPGGESGSAQSDAPAQDDLKAKYREALAHKHSSHGAAAGGHGDRGSTPHGTNAGPGQRMFRRKSG